jgi:phosphoglycolate phosphatase
MIKSYKHIIWDWNGTISCDVDLGIEIMNGLLHQRSLPLLTSLSCRDLLTIPVKDYYVRLGFDFVKEPFEIVGKLRRDEYDL